MKIKNLIQNDSKEQHIKYSEIEKLQKILTVNDLGLVHSSNTISTPCGLFDAELLISL